MRGSKHTRDSHGTNVRRGLGEDARAVACRGGTSASRHANTPSSGQGGGGERLTQVHVLVTETDIGPGSIEVVEGDIGMRDLGVGLEPCQYNRILLINRLSL